ncbi:MAG: hypothetical protein JXA42_24670 [Anaerolineales bacterium]|nr:hypothetical protein [Anaerolineales bacterium]
MTEFTPTWIKPQAAGTRFILETAKMFDGPFQFRSHSISVMLQTWFVIVGVRPHVPWFIFGTFALIFLPVFHIISHTLNFYQNGIGKCPNCKPLIFGTFGTFAQSILPVLRIIFGIPDLAFEAFPKN